MVSDTVRLSGARCLINACHPPSKGPQHYILQFRWIRLTILAILPFAPLPCSAPLYSPLKETCPSYIPLAWSLVKIVSSGGKPSKFSVMVIQKLALALNLP